MSKIAKITSVAWHFSNEGKGFYITTAKMEDGSVQTSATSEKNTYSVGEEVNSFHNSKYNRNGFKKLASSEKLEKLSTAKDIDNKEIVE